MMIRVVGIAAIVAAVLLTITATTVTAASEWVHVHGVDYHRDCIFQVDDASRIERLPDGRGTNIHYPDGRIEHKPSCAGYRGGAGAKKDNPTFTMPWVARAAAINEPTFGFINTSWTIPSNPAVTDPSTLLIYWVGLQNHDATFLFFDGAGAHWGAIPSYKGYIGGPYWTVCTWDHDPEYVHLFAGKPFNASAGDTITTTVNVKANIVTVYATIQKTGEVSGHETQTVGDFTGHSAYLGVGVTGVTEKTCNKLPASRAVVFKDIVVQDKQYQPIKPHWEREFPGQVCMHEVKATDNTVAITWYTD